MRAPQNCGLSTFSTVVPIPVGPKNNLLFREIAHAMERRAPFAHARPCQARAGRQDHSRGISAYLSEAAVVSACCLACSARKPRGEQPNGFAVIGSAFATSIPQARRDGATTRHFLSGEAPGRTRFHPSRAE